MSGAVVVNRVLRDFYLDSIALMRLSTELAATPGIIEAALMIGSLANKGLLTDSGMLAGDGEGAGASDLILAVRATDGRAATTALDIAIDRLAKMPVSAGPGGGAWRPQSMRTAMATLPEVNMALISVPGEFAVAETRKAISLGLNPMIFSDNVTLADERSLKELARARDLLVMGPDCGTALIGGVPLAFANEVPRGDIGIVAASGTGLQEVSCLIARHGRGVSHGIGVGGRDLSIEVGAISTLTALDLLESDSATQRIVLISKPPAPEVARRVLERVERCGKPTTICLLGGVPIRTESGVRFADTLRAAAAMALGADLAPFDLAAAMRQVKRRRRPAARRIVGLFCGGTLCTEAQVIMANGGIVARSNAPLPGHRDVGADGHEMIDLGADEFTRGRPHPMIDPSARAEAISRALDDPTIGVVLLDVVLGYGAHADPAGAVVAALGEAGDRGPVVVASVTGTNGDPQRYDDQVARLEAAGVAVAPSNADAAALALALIGASR
jgi:succinyl-CoA synthetase alpha subunit